MIRSFNLILEKTAMHQPISYDVWKYQMFQHKNYTKHLLWAIYSTIPIMLYFFLIFLTWEEAAAPDRCWSHWSCKKRDYYSTCILKSVKCALFQLNAQALNMKVGEKKRKKRTYCFYMVCHVGCWTAAVKFLRPLMQPLQETSTYLIWLTTDIL